MHCQTVSSQSPSEGGVVNPNVLLLPPAALGALGVFCPWGVEGAVNPQNVVSPFSSTLINGVMGGGDP